MNCELKLRFLKAAANLFTRILDKLLKFPEKIEYPQTRMLLRTYEALMDTYCLDCVQGTFGSKPDGNFERLLRTSAKFLAQISELDCYYRAQIGLTFLLTRDEMLKFHPSIVELRYEIKRQWHANLTTLPEHWFKEQPNDFIEWLLCNGLYNLATGFFTGTELPKNKKLMEEKKWHQV